MSLGTLYLIPVPLAEDAATASYTLFHKEIINSIDEYVVENEKTARFHLSALNLQKPINQLHFEVLDKSAIEAEITNYLRPLLEGFDIGLISESGCPAVADPGSKMVALAHQKNIKVIPMTGPSSIILALMASGLNGQQFKFHGYLPSEKEDRIKKIIAIENDFCSNGIVFPRKKFRFRPFE